MDNGITDYEAFTNELADPDHLLEYFEHLLEYILRVHLKHRHALCDADLDTEIENLRRFLRSPLDHGEPTVQGQAVVLNE